MEGDEVLNSSERNNLLAELTRNWTRRASPSIEVSQTKKAGEPGVVSHRVVHRIDFEEKISVPLRYALFSQGAVPIQL